MADHRRQHAPVAGGPAIIAAALGKVAEVLYLDTTHGGLNHATGRLSLCEDSDEIVLESDGGATFLPIARLVKIEVLA